MIEHYIIQSASHYLEEEDKTLVLLQRSEPYRYLTVKVPGNIRDKSDTEIKQLALEQVYKEEFAERANAEQFESIETQLQAINGATMEMAGMVAQIMGGANNG